MKVGIFVTNQNPLGTDMVSALDEQFAMTRLARDRGWDAVGTGQHYLIEGMSQLQLIPFLARLAAEAGEMTGVAGVLLINLHNPVEVAECIASLDVIWRGNFVFGVGLGYREVEFDAFNVPKGQLSGCTRRSGGRRPHHRGFAAAVAGKPARSAERPHVRARGPRGLSDLRQPRDRARQASRLR
jgi:hypothetical protein